MNTETERATLTIPEAAKILGCGVSVTYEAARTGKIPTLRFNRKILVPRAALLAMLAGGNN